MLPSIQAGRFKVGLGGLFDTPGRRQVVLFVTNIYALGGLLSVRVIPTRLPLKAGASPPWLCQGNRLQLFASNTVLLQKITSIANQSLY
jgi:hypothetical protein